MEKDLELFIYKHVDNKAPKTLFLLHGTGGDENDFLFLDNILEQQYNLVAIRGNVQENGMNRYFKRSAAGVFDQENIREETQKMSRFLKAWEKKFAVTPDTSIFLGYSNGANMILAMLFYYPDLIKNSVLLHPMLPFEPEPTTRLTDHTVYVSIGSRDTMIPFDESIKTTQVLTDMGANLTVKEYNSGHGITDQEIDDVAGYLETIISD